MIKNVLGAVVGAQLAKNTPKIDNGTGAIIGSIVPAVIARMSLPTMIALGVGGYLLKRHRDQQATTGVSGQNATSHTPASSFTPVSPATQA